MKNLEMSKLELTAEEKEALEIALDDVICESSVDVPPEHYHYFYDTLGNIRKKLNT